MTANKFILPLLLLALTSCYAEAQLQLYAAGAQTATVSVLKDGDKICPADFSKGFTIRCLESSGDRRAIFTVDGKFVRKEVKVPFFIRGDRDGMSYPWKDYPTQAEFTVECQTTHSIAHVTLSIACPASFNLPMVPEVPKIPIKGPTETIRPISQQAPGLYFRPVDKPLEGGVPIVDGLSICPKTELGSSQFTIACVSARMKNSAVFSIDGSQVRVERTPPLLIAGDNGGMAYPWRKNVPTGAFSVSCELGDGSFFEAKDVRIGCGVGYMGTEAPVTTTVIGTTDAPTTTVVSATTSTTNPNGCLIIPTMGVSLADGWKETTDGVGFKLGDRSKALTPAGESALNYTFKAKVTGRHAVVLDMTTGGKVDYNDVWIRLTPGGFMLSRQGATRFETDWIKAYHNLNKRVALTNSVDFTGHSISTGAVLKRDETYDFSIAGRSNNVIVHRVLLFPCDGVGCERRSWKVIQEQCVPGSTDYYD